MAINADIIRKKLSNLQNQAKKQNNIWKPAVGSNLIRIVPYKFNKEDPFIELSFHYGINNKSYLSPQTFGRPDPISEYAEYLKGTGNKDDYIQGKSLEAKTRIYAPIVVRGKENEGVKFWGFGKTVYEALLLLMNDADYGDITDITHGHDITVEVKASTPGDKSFTSPTIRARPAKTKLTDSREQLKALFDSQKNILEVFEELSYEDLSEILESWINGGEPPKKEDKMTEDDASSVLEESTSNITNVKPQIKHPAKSATATKQEAPSVVKTNADDIASELDKLFEDAV